MTTQYRHMTSLITRLRADSTVAKFGVVGLLGACSYYLWLYAMVERLYWLVLTATSFAFVLVTLQNYLLHHRWTFQSETRHVQAFPRFLFMNGVGFCLNWVIMFIGVQKLAWYYLFVQGLAIGVVVAWNVILSFVWIFADQGKRA